MLTRSSADLSQEQDGQRKVKVLLVEPFGHREGHPSFESQRVSYALVDAGADITLVTFMGVQGDWADNEKKVAHLRLFKPWQSLLVYYHYLNRLPLVRSILKILETFLTVSFALWRNRKRYYDVIHIFDSEPTFFFTLAFASLLRGHTLAFTVYNPPPPPENWHENLRNSIQSREWGILIHALAYELGESKPGTWLRSRLYRRALKNNHLLLVCHTEQLIKSYANYMGGIFRDKFVCIPLGVERPTREVSREYARQYLGLHPTRRIFLTFGNNHQGKDFEVIFQAFQGLPRDFIILQAGKLGTAPESADPERLGKKYGCSENTVVKDIFVPEEEKAYYFQAADAVILSYKKNFIQSASIINDAAKFSTPVIASEVSQLGEFVKSYDLGITFTPEDPDSLRQAILRFVALADGEREAIRGNFAQFRDAYSWEENALTQLDVYRRLMSQAPT